VRFRDGEYPYILLAGNEKLSLPEIYRLKLNANLVILSSCSGNAGDLKLGEGIMSLARGFNYAGCFSLMTSQWQVRQDALSGLVIKYVENLKAGMAKDMALGEAKRTYLASSSELESDPYFWAGLTQIGATNQLYVNDGWLSFKSTFEGRFPAGVVYLLLIILGILTMVVINNRRQTD
jgi:CHAT domain-containing protein